ncbi:MAG: TIR domain-containing protein [Thermodesulfobacterium sp.]|nr:TIR domain-containing protein [Thermodesulfobacterium sp.]
MPIKIYNIFLSHSWSYSYAYERLMDLLEKAPYFYFKDYSVPKDDPIHNAPNSQALYEAIKKQMAPCHVILVMAGVYATYSAWIKKEIKIAKTEFKTPKPVIAIKPWAQTRISQFVAENADEIVGWNTNSIVSAIRRLAI